MKLWTLRQTIADSANCKHVGIIGVFETKEEALAHISEELPKLAEYWKTYGDRSFYTNGTNLLIRYPMEIETGKILDEHKQFTKDWAQCVLL